MTSIITNHWRITDKSHKNNFGYNTFYYHFQFFCFLTCILLLWSVLRQKKSKSIEKTLVVFNCSRTLLWSVVKLAGFSPSRSRDRTNHPSAFLETKQSYVEIEQRFYSLSLLTLILNFVNLTIPHLYMHKFMTKSCDILPLFSRISPHHLQIIR